MQKLTLIHQIYEKLSNFEFYREHLRSNDKDTSSVDSEISFLREALEIALNKANILADNKDIYE